MLQITSFLKILPSRDIINMRLETEASILHLDGGESKFSERGILYVALNLKLQILEVRQ